MILVVPSKPFILRVDNALLKGGAMDGGIWRTGLTRLLIFECFVQLGTTSINPLVSNYAIALGASLVFAGFLAGLNSFTALLLRVLGSLICSGAERKVLTLSAIAFFISSLICVVFDSLSSLVISRVVMGVAFVMKSCLVVALASMYVPRNCVGQGVGWIGAVGIAANALGPGFGSFLGGSFGYRAVFVVSSVLFAAGVCMSLILRDPRGEKQDEGGDYRVRALFDVGAFKGSTLRRFFCGEVIPVSLMAGMVTFGFGSVSSLLLLVGDERGIAAVSLYFFIYAVVTVAVRPFSGKMYDNRGLSAMFYPLAVCMFASLVVLAFAGDLFQASVSAVLLALGHGCLYALFQAESVKLVPAEKATMAANTFYLGADAGMAIGPIVSGLVYQVYGSASMFLCNSLVAAALVGSFSVWSRAKKVA